MTNPPLLSFIVLSYNYERHILTTLRSILAQTVADLEVVVVDDASSDRSCELIAGLGDSRTRLLKNNYNIGGAASYNRAVNAARGKFLVNLDADDWTAPTRCARQLSMFERDPDLDIVGTHVVFVGSDGLPHPRAEELEPFVNGNFDLNRLSSWICTNHLCRSSTMVRREAHLRIGMDDPGMARAPDYELWTRALRLGCHFGMVPEPLTFYRLHDQGVTHADPKATMLEMCYALIRNLLPLIQDRGAYPFFCKALEWMIGLDAFTALRPIERYRLLGLLLTSPELRDYGAFAEAVTCDGGSPAIARAGQWMLGALARADGTFIPLPGRTERGTSPGMEGADQLRDWLAAMTEDRERWKERCLAGEQELALCRQILARSLTTRAASRAARLFRGFVGGDLKRRTV